MKNKIISLSEHYLTWHYGQAYVDIYHVWMNFIWFFFNFFSINLLLKTFLQPWKRMGEEYPLGFDPERVIQTWIVNMLMRFVGIGLRSAIIFIGLFFASATMIFGILVLIIWTFMPVFFIALIILGISLIIYG